MKPSLENLQPEKSRFYPTDRHSSDFRDQHESFAFHNPRQSSLSAVDVWFDVKEEKGMPGLEWINRCGRLIVGERRDFLKYYLKKCPALFHICYDPIGTHRKARAFIGFLFGFVAAVVLYQGIIVNLQFDTYTSLSLGAILVAMLSIGCASSIQVISFLTSLNLAYYLSSVLSHVYFIDIYSI